MPAAVKDNLLAMLLVPNQKLQLLALQLLLSQKLSANEQQRLFDAAPAFTEKAKPEFFANLVESLIPSDIGHELGRETYLRVIQKSITEDEPSTLLEVMRSIKELKLSQDEVEKLMPSLCRVKQQQLPHNQSAMEALLKKDPQTKRLYFRC